jgi:hypothetical protein
LFSKNDWNSVENIKQEYSQKLKALRVREETESETLKEKYSKMLKNLEAKNLNNLESINEYKERLHKLSEEKEAEKENLKKIYQEKIDELKSNNKLTLEELQKKELELTLLKKQNENEYLLLKNKEKQIKELKALITKNKMKRKALEEKSKIDEEENKEENKLENKEENIKENKEKNKLKNKQENKEENKEENKLKNKHENKEENKEGNKLKNKQENKKQAKNNKFSKDQNISINYKPAESKNKTKEIKEKNIGIIVNKLNNKTNLIPKNDSEKNQIKQNIPKPVNKTVIDIPNSAMNLKPKSKKTQAKFDNKSFKKINKIEKNQMNSSRTSSNFTENKPKSLITDTNFEEEKKRATKNKTENNYNNTNSFDTLIKSKISKRENEYLNMTKLENKTIDNLESLNKTDLQNSKKELYKRIELEEKVTTKNVDVKLKEDLTKENSKFLKPKFFSKQVTFIKKEFQSKGNKDEFAALGKILNGNNDNLLYKKLNCMDRTHIDSKHFLLSNEKCKQLGYLFGILIGGFHILEQKVFFFREI